LTFFICLLAKLRPTIHPIVIVIIIGIIGEAKLVLHDGGIIAQSFRSRVNSLPGVGMLQRRLRD
jgi:hypothetical protein